MNFSPYVNIDAPQRRGVALMLVMIAILVVGGMAVAYFGSRDNSIAISANVSSASRARISTESGLDLAIAILETNTDWRTNHENGVILQDYQLADSLITIIVIDSETELPPTETTFEVELTIESTVEGRTQVTQATATIIPNDDEFDVDYSEFAVFARNTISIGDAASVQNWVASPSYSQSALQIGTLATHPMAVQLDTVQSILNVKLHAYDTASSMLSTTSLRRAEFHNQMPFYAPPAPPTGDKELVLSSTKSFGSHKRNSRSHDSKSNFRSFSFGQTSSETVVETGEYFIDNLTLTGMRSIVIKGDVTITVKDDLDLNYAAITLAEDATLAIHVGGELTITSSYIGNVDRTVNSWMNPNRVKLFGNGQDDWKITGNSVLKGELYAPNCEIELRGSSTVCGRIAGNDVNIGESARVLYDQSLDHGGFAETDGILYNDNGTLRSELLQVTELNPALLHSIEQAIYANTGEYPIDSDAYAMSNHSYFTDWQSEPTDRPHEVIYEILVYGTDAHRWEQLARTARNVDSTTSINGNNQTYNSSRSNEVNQFDWDDLDLDDDWDWMENRFRQDVWADDE